MTDIRDQIHDPRLVQLFDYWDGIRGNQPMPARRDMDPLDIPAMLANIVLLDVEHAPLRFRVRVQGTAVAVSRGRDITGRYMDEFEEFPMAAVFIRANQHVAETMAPHIMTMLDPDKRGRPGYFHRLGLPLSDDGSRVDMILAGHYRETGSSAETLAVNIAS